MDISDIIRHALIVVVTLSAPPLIAATILGVGVSLVQSLFQVQDQTLSFMLKLIAVCIILYATGGWMESEITLLSTHMFDLMGNVH
jgi:type III secretion protein S